MSSRGPDAIEISSDEEAIEVPSGEIEDTEMSSGEIEESKMSNGGTEAIEIASGEIDESEMSNGGTVAIEIASGEIEESELSNGGTEAIEIASGEIEESEMSNGGTEAIDIASGEIGESEMSNGGTEAIEIASGEIEESELSNGGTEAIEIASGEIEESEMSTVSGEMEDIGTSNGGTEAIETASGEIKTAIMSREEKETIKIFSKETRAATTADSQVEGDINVEADDNGADVLQRILKYEELTVKLEPVWQTDLTSTRFISFLKEFPSGMQMHFERKNHKKQGYVELQFDLKSPLYLLTLMRQIRQMIVYDREIPATFPDGFIEALNDANKFWLKSLKKKVQELDDYTDALGQRQVMLGPLLSEVTREDIQAMFPGVIKVTFMNTGPKSTEKIHYHVLTFQPHNQAVLEFVTAAEAKDCLDTTTSVILGDSEVPVFKAARLDRYKERKNLQRYISKISDFGKSPKLGDSESTGKTATGTFKPKSKSGTSTARSTAGTAKPRSSAAKPGTDTVKSRRSNSKSEKSTAQSKTNTPRKSRSRRSTAKPEDNFPASTMTSDPSLAHARVFVGNLDTEAVSRMKVQEIFAPYGRILGISMHKGYSFVQYSRESEAAKAIAKEKGKVYGGKAIDPGFGRRKGNSATTSGQAAKRSLTIGKAISAVHDAKKRRLDNNQSTDSTRRFRQRQMPRNQERQISWSQGGTGKSDGGDTFQYMSPTQLKMLTYLKTKIANIEKITSQEDSGKRDSSRHRASESHGSRGDSRRDGGDYRSGRRDTDDSHRRSRSPHRHDTRGGSRREDGDSRSRRRDIDDRDRRPRSPQRHDRDRREGRYYSSDRAGGNVYQQPSEEEIASLYVSGCSKMMSEGTNHDGRRGESRYDSRSQNWRDETTWPESSRGNIPEIPSANQWEAELLVRETAELQEKIKRLEEQRLQVLPRPAAQSLMMEPRPMMVPAVPQQMMAQSRSQQPGSQITPQQFSAQLPLMPLVPPSQIGLPTVPIGGSSYGREYNHGLDNRGSHGYGDRVEGSSAGRLRDREHTELLLKQTEQIEEQIRRLEQKNKQAKVPQMVPPPLPSRNHGNKGSSSGSVSRYNDAFGDYRGGY